MRGRNIVLLALIGLMLGATVSAGAFANGTPTIFVAPDFTTGLLPGDAFGCAIVLTGGVNVYAWEIQLDYYPYMQILVVTDVIEGDYLMMYGDETFMAYNLDHFRGSVRVGGTLVGDVPGISGDGVLCIIVFSVIEAGECALDLHDTVLLDPDGIELGHDAIDGYYLGPTCDFIPPPYPNERPVGGGKEQAAWVQSMIKKYNTAFELNGDLENNGYAPIYARLKFTSVNQKTGETYTLRSGQNFMSDITQRVVYLYVNEEIPAWDHWDKIGASPYLDAPDDGNYIESDFHCMLSNLYGFEDVTGLGPMDQIVRVELEGYTRADSTDPDFDVYVIEPDWSFAWLGSLWGEADWTWKTPRWVGSDVVSDIWPSALDPALLNQLAVTIHHYIDGHIELDCLRLRVTIQTGGVLGDPGVYYLEPGEFVTPDPAIWYLIKQDQGKWYTTISIEYKYIAPAPGIPEFWTTSDTTYTFEWWCKGEYLP